MIFKITVETIVAENTKYNSIGEIPNFETVEIKSGLDTIMNLHIRKEGSNQVSVAHYNEGD